jgi:hypothetical protein
MAKPLTTKQQRQAIYLRASAYATGVCANGAWQELSPLSMCQDGWTAGYRAALRDARHAARKVTKRGTLAR